MYTIINIERYLENTYNTECTSIITTINDNFVKNAIVQLFFYIPAPVSPAQHPC